LVCKCVRYFGERLGQLGWRLTVEAVENFERKDGHDKFIDFETI
jgi:hypothetical protein